MKKLLYLFLVYSICIHSSLTEKHSMRDDDEDDENDEIENVDEGNNGNDENQEDIEKQEEQEEDDDEDDDDDDKSQDTSNPEEKEEDDKNDKDDKDDNDDNKKSKKQNDNEHYHNEHNYQGEDEFEEKPEAASPVVPKNKTTTQECHVDSKVYKEGDVIPRASPCEHCTCRSGHSRCHHKHCFPRFCTKTYIPDGECCPICACKDQHGKDYTVGQQFVTEHRLYGMGEMCMECNCKANTKGHAVAHCSYQLCPPMKNCVETFVPEGKCCPVCKAFGQLLKPCTFEGQTKSHGVHWKLDTCFACTCSNGEVICNKNCPELKCRTKYRPGECCPVCEDGTTHARTFPPFPPFHKKPTEKANPKTFPPFPPILNNNNAQPKTFPPFPKF